MRGELLGNIISGGGGAKPTNQLGSSNSFTISKAPYWSKKSMIVKNTAYTVDHPTKAQLETRVKFGKKARGMRGRKGFDVVTNSRSKAAGMSLPAVAAGMANSRLGRSSYSKPAGQHASELRRTVHTLEELAAMRTSGGVHIVSRRAGGKRRRRKSSKSRKHKAAKKMHRKRKKSRKAKRSHKKARKSKRKAHRRKHKASKRRKGSKRHHSRRKGSRRSKTVFVSTQSLASTKSSLPVSRLIHPAKGHSGKGVRRGLRVKRVSARQLSKMARGALSTRR